MHFSCRTHPTQLLLWRGGTCHPLSNLPHNVFCMISSRGLQVYSLNQLLQFLGRQDNLEPRAEDLFYSLLVCCLELTPHGRLKIVQNLPLFQGEGRGQAIQHRTKTHLTEVFKLRTNLLLMQNNIKGLETQLGGSKEGKKEQQFLFSTLHTAAATLFVLG